MNKKIFVSVVLVLSLVLSLATVSFADGTFKLNASAGEWNENNEIEIIVSVENNPGIAGFGYALSYDGNLIKPVKTQRLHSKTDIPGILNSGMTDSSPVVDDGLYVFNVSHLAFKNTEGDGNIHKIIFKLTGEVTAENSGQTVEIKLVENPNGHFYNASFEEVVPVYGSVSVTLPSITEGEAGGNDTPVDDSNFSDTSDDFEDIVENYRPSYSGNGGSGTTNTEKKYKTVIVLTIDSVEIKVNKNTLINDVAPIIVNDRTMLPIRVIAEELGAKVGWDEAQQKVTVTKDDKKITVYIDSDTAYVNDEVVKLDSPAFLQNSRTYLPLRFISENLGAEVDWDGDLQQVTIKK